jgi:hypothetical protein
MLSQTLQATYSYLRRSILEHYKPQNVPSSFTVTKAVTRTKNGSNSKRTLHSTAVGFSEALNRVI